MEIRQLEYFVAVVEEASFTHAAARVHVSQSGVSAQVRRLERELGEALLDRSERTVRPTEAGAAILPYARAALAAVAGTRQAVDDLAGLVLGRVTVGMVTACTVTVLFDLLAEFHARHPGVDITLTEDSSDRLIEGVHTGRFDLVLAGLSGALPHGLESITLADEALVAAVRPEDALAGLTNIRLSELNEHDLVCMTRGSGVRASFDTACDVQGVRPRVVFEASAPDVVAGLARRGLGVAVLTESMAAAHSEHLHAITIEGASPRARLDLAWRAGGTPSPAALALIGRARDRFAAPVG